MLFTQLVLIFRTRYIGPRYSRVIRFNQVIQCTLYTNTLNN